MSKEKINECASTIFVGIFTWLVRAVWSYSDLIYKTSKTPEKTETQKNTNDLSLPDALKPQPTVNSEPITQNAEEGPSATTLNSTQPIEEQSMSQ